VSAHYRAPGWLTRKIFNRAVALSTCHGVSILRTRILAVRGNAGGAWRTTPVNLLDHDGRRYLVSTRGRGQWIHNLRAEAEPRANFAVWRVRPSPHKPGPSTTIHGNFSLISASRSEGARCV
jgi:hypothetical protein